MSVFFLNSQPSPFLCFSLIKKKCQTSLELSRSGGREPQIEERKWDHLSLRRPLRGIEKKTVGHLAQLGLPSSPLPPPSFLRIFCKKKQKREKKKLPLHLTPNLLDSPNFHQPGRTPLTSFRQICRNWGGGDKLNPSSAGLRDGANWI